MVLNLKLVPYFVMLICMDKLFMKNEGAVLTNEFLIQLQKIDEEVAVKLGNVDQMVSQI